MKSIKWRILVPMLSTVLAVILLLIGLSVSGIYLSTMFALEEAMNATANTASVVVEAQLEEYKALMTEIAADDVLTQDISSPSSSGYKSAVDEIQERTAEIAARQDFSAVYVATAAGQIPYADIDVTSREYFTQVQTTLQPYVTDPLVSQATGELEMFAVAPIIKNNSFAGCVIASIEPEVFSHLISEVSIGEGSVTAVVDNTGTLVAHTVIQNVYDRANYIEQSASNPSMVALAGHLEDVIAGNSGFGTYSNATDEMFIAYHPIPESNNWGIYVGAVQAVFLQQMILSIVFSLVAAAVCLLAAVIVISITARKISKPVSLCAMRLEQLASGDISSPAPDIRTQDETGKLAKATATITTSIETMISSMRTQLSNMSDGNFASEMPARDGFVGEFKPLVDSFDDFTGRMVQTLSQVGQASEQVSAGAEQVSLGAQSLAQGATEQASAIAELAATINDMSDKIQSTADDSQEAKKANTKAQDTLLQSREQMQMMVAAMEQITDKSNEIGKIIKTIDDIAFQTNILSLNAAVEAARAGASGKGFAVVADEVRSLATKSAQSAKDTATLIAETLTVVKSGNSIARDTSESVELVFGVAAELGALVENIAIASSDQASGAGQVNIGIDQISSVIQTNSATAEESAAASEELSGQSQMLKDLVATFTLPSVGDSYSMSRDIDYDMLNSENAGY